MKVLSDHFSPLSSPAGTFKGFCKQIDHFPEDTDYEADASEYFLRESHHCYLFTFICGYIHFYSASMAMCVKYVKTTDTVVRA